MNESCGCCEGIEKLTPLPTANRPGLDALVYRVGTHATFLETTKARLTDLSLEVPLQGGSDETRTIYPLRSLTTRTANDPALALLDAWATVADVLTFYQERIANEGYLRTATERRSILELARLVGYTLRPGVAASVYLAFTLEEGYDVEVPAGTRAQSLPAPGELPQSFETSEPLRARAAWNQLGARLTRPQLMTFDNAATKSTLYFQGTTINVNPNDRLLLILSDSPNQNVLRKIEAALAQAAENRTKVILQQATTAQPGVAAVSIDAVRQIVEGYLNLDAFGVSSESAMTRRVVETLHALQTSLTPGTTPESIAALLRATYVPQLRREHATAIEGNYTRLEPWVGGLVAELENIAGVRGDATGAGPMRSGATGQQPQTRGGLGVLIEPLLTPPSLQPANRQRLERSVEQTFAPQADVGPQLLVTLNPRLETTLYRAWANSEVSLPSPFQSAEVLRVQAAPFGHNAPLKPLYDDQGRLVGSEEWPLGGTVTISLQLFSSQTDTGVEIAAPRRRNSQALISIRQDTTTQSALVSLEDQEVALNGSTVRIVETDNSGMGSFTFHFVELQREIRLESSADSSRVRVTIDNDPDRLITPGQTLRYSTNGRKVMISYGQAFHIQDESPAPVPEHLRNVLALDAQYDQVVPKSWVVIERSDKSDPIIGQVVKTQTVSKAEYGLTGKVTQLTLDRPWLEQTDVVLSVLRGTTVYAQSESLALAEEPIEESIRGDRIELAALYGGLEAGQWLIVAGERIDIPNTSGVPARELVMLAGVEQSFDSALPGDKTHTTLILADSLAYSYKRDTVTIYGNVVKATHGETRTEVLGSGDGSQSLQHFSLRHSPLTHLAAANPSGAESTLEVRVNDVQWHEERTLAGRGPNEQIYITRTDNEDKTAVIFGDGLYGLRLPTGAENVTSVYRNGIGKVGNVAAEQISLLATRPLGVRSVINPRPATGGADRESRDQARRNAPLALMSLDRLVSIPDYADFARTFAGIGKAKAVRLSDGRRQVVHLTIAGADDIPINKNSDLYRNLCQALHQFGDPYQPVQVNIRELLLLIISARVRVLPDYQWESIEPQVRTALLDTFSFERRELGQDVVLSEVISTIQRVPGVAYVDVDILDGVSEAIPPQELAKLAENLQAPNQPKQRIIVNTARVDLEDGKRVIKRAQLAYLSPEVADTLILTELPS